VYIQTVVHINGQIISSGLLFPDFGLRLTLSTRYSSFPDPLRRQSSRRQNTRPAGRNRPIHEEFREVLQQLTLLLGEIPLIPSTLLLHVSKDMRIIRCPIRIRKQT
jgi:hypothetical protein